MGNVGSIGVGLVRGVNAWGWCVGVERSEG